MLTHDEKDMKPYLFLDIDGVLNRISSHGDTWPDFELHKLAPFNGNTFYLWLSKSMATELISLPVDIVWLTTWAEEAPRLVAPILGMPEYPVAGFGTDMTEGRGSKLGCVEWWMDTHGERPFIWIDDDAIPHFAAEDFKEVGWNALLIEPNYTVGITWDHINAIRAFCNEVSS